MQRGADEKPDKASVSAEVYRSSYFVPNPIKSRKTHQKKATRQSTMSITRGRKMISIILLHLCQQSIKIHRPQITPTMVMIIVKILFPSVGGVSAYTKYKAYITIGIAMQQSKIIASS